MEMIKIDVKGFNEVFVQKISKLLNWAVEVGNGLPRVVNAGDYGYIGEVIFGRGCGLLGLGCILGGVVLGCHCYLGSEFFPLPGGEGRIEPAHRVTKLIFCFCAGIGVAGVLMICLGLIMWNP